MPEITKNYLVIPLYRGKCKEWGTLDTGRIGHTLFTRCKNPAGKWVTRNIKILMKDLIIMNHYINDGKTDGVSRILFEYGLLGKDLRKIKGYKEWKRRGK